MTSGPSRVDELDGSERDEAGDVGEDDAHDRESSSRRSIRDPVLALFVWGTVALDSVSTLHRRFERLPGWVRFSVGVTTFVASAYLGDDVRLVVDALAHVVLNRVVRRFLELPTGIKTLLVFVAVVSVQTTVVNKRTKAIQAELQSSGMTADDTTVPDGGRVYRTLPSTESGRTGALGGIVPGMALGMLFGWGGMFGGAVLGAIVGDEIERWYDRRRNRRKIASFVIQSFLREGVESPDSIPVDHVRSWFPSRDADLVDDVLADLTSGEDAPLVAVSDDRVRLTTVDEAETYLREEFDMITLPR
jgi:hypothetical protein